LNDSLGFGLIAHGTDMEMSKRVKKVLSGRRRRIVSTNRLTRAAVLVPLFQKGGRYHVLLTKRTDRVKHHKGEISFPGGVVDEVDENMEATALRETFEEIGLPREDMEILGKLDDAVTISSAYLITPIVAEITHPYPFSVNEVEIEELIEIPLEAFLDENRWTEEIYSSGDKKVPSYRFEYEGKIIWGATARIMRQFLDTLSEDQ
jgi:8-oxo-dGTP pyrophosphatase MutT (NUDIX family)